MTSQWPALRARPLPVPARWRIGPVMFGLVMRAWAVALLGLAVPIMAQPAAPAAEPTPLIPTASIDNSLEITGETLEAEQQRNRLFIDVSVNDQGPFRFLVDSGADRSAIGAGLADRLQLPAGDPVRLQGMAGIATVRTVVIDRLSLGNSEMTGIRAPALAERDLGAQGLIGIDALAEQRLLLDFEARTITVQDARSAPVNQAGEIVVTARLRKGQLIITQASIEDQRISAVIDTGSEVTLGNMALRRKLFGTRPRRDARMISLISVTGQSLQVEVIPIPRIRIGGVYLDNVVVAFGDASPFALFGLDKQPALFLGSDLLKSFRRVSLDFRNRKVRFWLRR
jgi:predicted aspartyl protease